MSFFAFRCLGLVVDLLSGLLFTVLDDPWEGVPLGVGDSHLSLLSPLSELPDPELTPLKTDYYDSGSPWQ